MKMRGSTISWIVALQAAFLLVVTSSMAQASPLARLNRTFSFAGLWGGLDVVDGSPNQLAIIPRGGHFELITKSTFFNSCDSSDGQGVLIGTGVISGGRLVSEQVLRCESGNEVFFSITYVPDEVNDTLTLEFRTSRRSPLTFFRVSTPRFGG